MAQTRSNSKTTPKTGNYLEILKHFNELDCHTLEQDLAYYERISIGFLLYGSDPINCNLVLQKLLVLHRDNYHYNGVIFDYTRINPVNWKHYLIEALTVIRAYKVLKKLGFNVAELKLCFLPTVPETSLYIHPLLKALHNMSERLTKDECSILIRTIKKLINPLHQLNFNDESFLEIYILHWLSINLINIGKWDRLNPSLSNNCDIDIILQQLKYFDRDTSIRSMLESVVRSFRNCDSKINVQNEQRFLELTQDPTASTASSFPLQQRNVRDSAAVTSSTSSDGNFLNYNNSHSNVNQNVINQRYVITKQSAGFILIINQKSFHKDPNPELHNIISIEDLPVRRGTDQDVEALVTTFTRFGYIPDLKNNLTSSEMLSAVKEVSRKSVAFHSVIICVLSHGIEGFVYGANSVPVAIQDIEDILAKSIELLSKPKMLIIQACQGAIMQPTITVSPYENDGPAKIINGSGFFDMITAISTIPRYASVRHTELGTWFIQTVCLKITELAHSYHIIDILTHVIREISYKRNDRNQCMVPRVIQQLTKALYFPLP